MAEYKGEYGHPYPRVDEYGNPVPPVDQYGNPIPREPASVAVGTGVSPADCGTGFYGVAPGDYGTVDTTFPPEDVVTGGVATAGTGAQFQPTREEHTVGAALQRSGSVSSSSSSEDDGQGGRRKKKSIKEKIKDKLPGTHKHEEQKVRHGQAQAGTPEKKGVIEKIKEKLPGHHH